MVVTGGGYPLTTVQVYSTDGAEKKLPDMKTARLLHACGHYFKDDKVVIMSSLIAN